MSQRTPPPRLEVTALPSPHRFTVGDDLVAGIVTAAEAARVEFASGDVVCVASKVVSITEGASIALPEVDDPRRARRELARREAVDIVADSPRVLVTRTRHGFVAANGGIDASNAPEGRVLLLPDDPDGSASALHAGLRRALGIDIGVIITDTFGRPWRLGQTDVALGVAGTLARRDERGRVDLDGRRLDVTEVAVADEIAGAADLVRSKSSGTPFVLVRGLPRGTPGTGRELLRPPEEDLFAVGGPTAAERAVADRRTVRAFKSGRPVPDGVLRAAVAAAGTAPAPHHTRPWRFLRLRPATRTRLLDAMADRWVEDLTADGVSPPTIERRLAASDRVLRRAPELLVPFVSLEDAHQYGDVRRSTAERELFLLSGGAALANVQIVLRAHGLGAAWMSSTVFCADTVRSVLDLAENWAPLGLLAIGWPASRPPPRGPVHDEGLLEER